MSIQIREYQESDLLEMTEIWNEVVDDGVAFPQMAPMTPEEAAEFFASQSFTGVAVSDGEVLGLYILHPNNIGRCGHIANASYAVRSSARGMQVGKQLVKHSLVQGGKQGFRLLQFNAVVKTNERAIRLYESLGFVQIGTIPQGFFMKDGQYEDIILYYHTL